MSCDWLIDAVSSKICRFSLLLLYLKYSHVCSKGKKTAKTVNVIFSIRNNGIPPLLTILFFCNSQPFLQINQKRLMLDTFSWTFEKSSHINLLYLFEFPKISFICKLKIKLTNSDWCWIVMVKLHKLSTYMIFVAVNWFPQKLNFSKLTNVDWYWILMVGLQK